MACAASCSAPGATLRAVRLALAHAESEAPLSDSAFAAADRFLADASVPKLPIRGADFIARGVMAGRPVGRALHAFRALWVQAGFPEQAETLTRLLAEASPTRRRQIPSAQEMNEPRSA